MTLARIILLSTIIGFPTLHAEERPPRSASTPFEGFQSIQPERADTAAPARANTSFRPRRSRGLAVLLSAVAPGAGQIYTGHYWKVPIIWGIGGYWVYEWIQLNNEYRDYRQRFLEEPTNARWRRLRDFYRDERDKFAWYLAALYVVNLVDAYVAASLFDFDVGDDLTHVRVNLSPSRISLQLNF